MRQKQKAKLAFRGIEISLEMHIWIQKAQALRKTAKDIIDGIYQQGKKDHMSNANMLAIIHGVFSDYSPRHLRTITPPELKKVNMQRVQAKKKIAAVPKSDTAANPDQVEQEQEQKKQPAVYEVKMDLEYNTLVKNWPSDFDERFDKAVWTYEQKGKDMKYFLTLPVIIKVNPDDQTATVQVDKVLLDSWMREIKLS